VSVRFQATSQAPSGTQGGTDTNTYIVIVTRQKFIPKRKKRVFRVCTLLTLLFITISIIILRIPLAPISNNKTFKKEFYLFEKLIIFKVFRFREKLLIII